MPSGSFALAAAVFALTAAACSAEVIQPQQSAGTTGSGGSTSTTTTTTGAGGSTSTTGAGGAPPAFCAGKAGIPCAADEWCQFDPISVCGNADGAGTCQPKPQGCPADCPGACGCDGVFYCNACEAHASGVDVAEGQSCASTDSYRAVSLFTNAPRFALLKASVTRNLCFRLTVQSTAGEGLGISGDGWAVESGEITHAAGDCDIPPGPIPPPMGASAPPSSGNGLLLVSVAPGQCTVGIHAKLFFAGQPAWVPPAEPIDAEGLVIEGGCP
jgi:hypothetical protein